MSAAVILVAAGRGERLGKGPKAFVALAGESLLRRAARAFEESAGISAIVAVVPQDMVEAARAQLAPCSKLGTVVAGGARRQDSVLAGLRALPKDWDGVVLVHDAARPFVDREVIERVIDGATRNGSAVPVAAVADTMKRLVGDRIVETLDRGELAAAQTPQGFRYTTLLEAYEDAERSGATLSDESMAVERRGHPVYAVAGSPFNRKITTVEDWAWAEPLARGPINT
jgi:2-C-methyl-D-erythritol 4-phosphate cytidylyltransferase